MKNIFISVIIVFFCLSLAGCATTKPCPPAPTIACPFPDKPVLKTLNVGKTLCAPDNVNTFLQNLKDTVEYSKKLEATVKCYEDSLKSKP